MKRVRALTLAIIVGGCILRATHLGAPLTFDEGFTLQAYVMAPYSAIVTRYDVPNNHVLLNLLLKAIDQAWPWKLVETMTSPWPLQFPSFVSAAASLWLLGEVAAALTGPVTALFAVLALSLSYWHLMYSHMVRGYSLSTALELGALWLCLVALRRRRAWPLFAAAVAAACAHYVVPSNAVFTAALAASLPWLASRRARAAQGKGKSRLPERPPVSWSWPAAAGVVCAALTLAAYRPILDQLIQFSSARTVGWQEAVLQTPERVRLALDLLGFAAPWIVLFTGISLLGLFAAYRGGARMRAAGIVAAAYLVVPVAVFSLQRTLPVSRIYLPGLPFWCLAFGIAARSASARASRFFASRSSRRLVAPGLALAAAAAFATQAAPYLRWDRGLDARDAVATVWSTVQDVDDFIVIATDMGDDPRFGEIDWDYYGYAAKLEPYEHLAVRKDPPYRARERYVVIADTEDEARAALRRSGVDEFMLGALRRTATSGRLGIFETRRDDAVKARYLAAVADAKLPAATRASAFAGLGAAALEVRNLADAREYFQKAKALAPDDEKIRFQTARNAYFAFDDRHAVEELSWVVSRDTANVDAPFYLADSLAQLGRDEEALKWYRWYFEPGRPGEAYVWKPFCQLGVDAIRQGKGSVKIYQTDANGWSKASRELAWKGAVERAALAMNYSTRITPYRDRLLQLAAFYTAIHWYTAAGTICRYVLDHGGTPAEREILAKILWSRNDIEGARRENDKVLAADPKNPDALDLAQELRRL